MSLPTMFIDILLLFILFCNAWSRDRKTTSGLRTTSFPLSPSSPPSSRHAVHRTGTASPSPVHYMNYTADFDNPFQILASSPGPQSTAKSSLSLHVSPFSHRGRQFRQAYQASLLQIFGMASLPVRRSSSRMSSSSSSSVPLISAVPPFMANLYSRFANAVPNDVDGLIILPEEVDIDENDDRPFKNQSSQRNGEMTVQTAGGRRKRHYDHVTVANTVRSFTGTYLSHPLSSRSLLSITATAKKILSPPIGRLRSLGNAAGESNLVTFRKIYFLYRTQDSRSDGPT